MHSGCGVLLAVQVSQLILQSAPYPPCMRHLDVFCLVEWAVMSRQLLVRVDSKPGHIDRIICREKISPPTLCNLTAILGSQRQAPTYPVLITCGFKEQNSSPSSSALARAHRLCHSSRRMTRLRRTPHRASRFTHRAETRCLIPCSPAQWSIHGL